MSTVTQVDVQAAQRFAQALSKYPSEVVTGVGLVIQNIPNGCTWAFVKDGNVDYEKQIEAIKNNSYMDSIKIRGGYLYSIKFDYLMSVLRKVAVGYVNDKELQIASEHRQKALVDLDKHMKKGKVGKIGIYNLNDSSNVVVDGVRYPAFCVTIQDLLTLCVRNGYYLKLGNSKRTPEQVHKRLVEVVSRLEVAPSANALFIEITK